MVGEFGMDQAHVTLLDSADPEDPMARFASRDEYVAWKASQADSPANTLEAPVSDSVPRVAAPSAAAPLASPATATRSKGLGEAFKGLPSWAWLFVVGCMAIPVVSLGGAIPAGLGFGSAAACANLAKRAGWETPIKVLACAGVTGGAWVLFVVFVVVVASIQK